MNYKRFSFIFSVITLSVFLLSSCRRVNEATELGDDLIPVVDNINTFDTTLTVESYNDIFAILSDSAQSFAGDQHVLGNISNDPIFGTTNAQIFLQLKPTFYKYAFLNVKDSLHLDSVVLILDYVETYGDTTVPQNLEVYEIDPSTPFKVDSNYYVNRNSFNLTTPLGTATIVPKNLNDSVKAFRDTTVNQLRIRLSDIFGRRLLDYDSSINPLTQAYRSDSLFNKFFKGFAIRSTSGNALMGFDLRGANTKLAIYYRDDNGNSPKEDTTVAYFLFTQTSASANYITRNHSGNVTAAAGGGQDPIVYIQSTPGTFATIKIPGLATLSNRVVHRAELIMEQLYDISDSTFTPPPGLMLDAYDPSISTFRTIPYDLGLTGSGTLDLVPFGVYAKRTTDPNGNPIRVWKFNLSRYVQHVLTGRLPVYDMRVYAPYYTFVKHGIPNIVSDVTRLVYVNPSVGFGRVRLGGGNHPTQRMRLRIIYSKI